MSRETIQTRNYAQHPLGTSFQLSPGYSNLCCHSSSLHPAIPKKEEIYKYSFKLDGYMNSSPQPNCLILVFLNESLFSSNRAPQSLIFNLRKVLDASADEELGRKGPQKIEELRERGVKVWSTFH
jgi:hypothetical protein